MRLTIACLVSTSLLLCQASAALPPIVLKGTKFFYENGTQFFIKGVAYEQESAVGGAPTNSTKYSDPLANADACKRDVPLLKALGTNTIRTYAVDPNGNHDECMKLLDDAGIYVISDLSEPSLSINREDPHWNVDLYKRYTGVVDNLSKYSNVIGFFACNEVTNNNTNTPASAYVKAAVRDTKAYIKANVNRWMGVGYAANDDPDIRGDIAHYFNCGNQTKAIDFWGYNIYEWCGKSTLKDSGYDKQIEFFKNYSVPVFLRREMTDVFSGGIAYMYFEETNDYGLVTVKGNSASTMKNYDALKTKMASVSPTSTDMSAYQPTNSPATCPELSKNWRIKGEILPPTPDSSLCDCMYKSLSCVPADKLEAKDYGDVFGYICSAVPEACAGINGNTTTGVYGAYSMCNAKQQLGFVLNEYYNNQNKAKDACDFKAKATLTTASNDSKCSAALASASSANSVAATSTGDAASQTSLWVRRRMPSSLGNTCALLGLCLLALWRNVAAVHQISLQEGIEAYPECAIKRQCLVTMIGTSVCAPDDLKCVCADDKAINVAAICIKSSCSVKETLTAKNITAHLCGQEEEKKDPSLIPVSYTFICLAVIAVVLRVVARVLTHAYFWWDDLANLLGFVGSAVFTALNLKAIDLGQGTDIWFVPFDNITRVLKIFYGQMLLYTITRLFVRASIILFYLRVFRADNKLGRILLFTFIFNSIYNFSFLIAVTFQCTPISEFWTQWSGEHEGHCGNANILVWVAAVTGIVFDLWLLALPFPQLLALNLSWKKKVMGGMMFSVGVA
ncbi:hypothetical protein VTI74DRAFT_9242 [Chaetomium olivicolor]